MKGEDIETLLEDPNWFPFVETWSKIPASVMFQNLVASPYGSIADIPKTRCDFTASDFKFSIPVRFRRAIPQLEGYVILTHDLGNKDYISMNAIGEFYMEDLRLSSSKRRFMDKTPIEMWDTDKRKILAILKSKNRDPEHAVTPYELRNVVFSYTKESNPFRPTVALAMYALFNAKSILDMSSGWGDRLIGALAWAKRSGQGIRYQGYDPFFALQERYMSIIRDFGSDDSRITVTCSPFEDSPEEEKNFDLAFTSPPYFDFEEYGLSTVSAKSGSGSITEDRTGQSTVRYSKVQEWVDGFLKPMIQKAARSLRIRGHLAINIEGPFMYNLLEHSRTDPLLFGLSDMKMEYLGIVGYKSDDPRDTYVHPTFVWSKIF